MADIHIKKDNPFILSETQTEDIERYKTLCDTVAKYDNIIEVTLFADKICIFAIEGKRTTKYPTKNYSFDWVLNKIRTAGGDAPIKPLTESQRLRALMKENGLI